MRYIEPGRRLLKGNLHMHTTRSDGQRSPDGAIECYRGQGYDFLALTDHWKPSIHYEVGGLIALPGVELDFHAPNQALHLVVVGAPPEAFDDVDRTRPQLAIDRARAAGGRVILAHPAWSLNTPQMIASLKGLTAAEVYNTVSGAPWNADRADSSTLLDVAAANGAPLNLVASDDAHYYAGEQCRACIFVQAERSEASILSAVDEGKYFSSTGARFTSIEFDGDELRVAFEPADEVIFLSNLPWVSKRCLTRPRQTSASYRIDRRQGETFVRCRIRDGRGMAWTNPFA
ncbi:MAG: hypothetical protein GX558_11320 [Clostridiales bacterium]|nr:hypothetical protein [Clostridiales bacterium]